MSIDIPLYQPSPPQRNCLFCEQPAASLEHIIPQRFGGRLARRIVCEQHNNMLGNKCDKPLVEQFIFFVHALQVVSDRGNPGAEVTSTTSAGHRITVGRDYRPRLTRMEVLERDNKNRPAKVIAPNEESALRLVSSMGLIPDNITMEVRRERLEPLNFSLQLGGTEGFRGILKIAYEYVRAHLNTPASDLNAENEIQDALLRDGDPLAYIRWLPYELADRLPQAKFFSHRVLAAPSNAETLVFIELFNTAPFIVRLPGIIVQRPHILFQGLRGEIPIEPEISDNLPFTWENVPEHAQPQMFTGFQERIGNIVTTMQYADLLHTSIEAFAVIAARNPSASDDQILENTVVEVERISGAPLQGNLVQKLHAFCSELLPLLRSGAFVSQNASGEHQG